MQNAKEFLEKLRKSHRRLQFLKYRIEELDADITKLTSVIKKDKVSQCSTCTGNENLLCRLLDKQAQLKKEEINLIKLRENTATLIDSLSSAEEAALLVLRYYKYYTWEQIQKTLFMSHTSVHNRHGVALKNFETLMKKHNIY